MRRFLLLGGAGMALVVMLLVVLSGAAGSARAASLTPAHTAQAFAALAILEDRVEVRPSGLSQWVAGEDGQGMVEGDGVRTDGEGFAELLYLDGSRTRLDGGTEFELVELDGDALAPIIRTRLDIGRTWHRVQHVTGERGAYEVETAVGTAAVRGTVFIVECDARPVCTFSVLEGIVVVTTPDGRQLTVEADEELTLGDEDGFEPGTVRAGDGGPDGGSAADPDAPDPGDPDGGPVAPEQPSDFPEGGPVVARGAIVEVGREQVPGGALSIRPFAAQNLVLDRTDVTYGASNETCAVTINGRNADLASSPTSAIDAELDDVLVIDALSTGPLTAYDVTLGLGSLTLPAASGPVEPGEDGDSSRFRGTVDVSQQARWGTGLYEVTATTSGTRCQVVTFINVKGGTPLAPLLTIPGVAALLIGVVSIAGLVSAISRATAQPVLAAPTIAAPTSGPTSGPFTPGTKR